MARTGVDDAVYSAEEGGPGLVVEDDDERSTRQLRNIVGEPLARLRAHVGEIPIHGDHVGGHEVELVDVPQPFASK
jgi:hypothetical protein